MSDDKAQAGQQEPSMEDILASIRRILSEDEEERSSSSDDMDDAPSAALDEPSAGKGAGTAEDGADEGARRRQPEGSQAEASTQTMGAETQSTVARGDDPTLASDSALEMGVPEIEFADVLELTPDMRVGPVVSAPTAVASTDVLAQLAKAILDRRDVAIGTRDVTLENMVREMLRPLLKEWLDRNLPYLIERLVKKEIDVMINRAERLED